MQIRQKRTDLPGLDSLALSQGGYFDVADASDHGLSKALVTYHLNTGRFERLHPGVYPR